jgi:hypothetical protein
MRQRVICGAPDNVILKAVKIPARLYPPRHPEPRRRRRISKYEDRRFVAAVVAAEILPASTRLQDDGEIYSQPLGRVDGRRISNTTTGALRLRSSPPRSFGVYAPSG